LVVPCRTRLVAGHSPRWPGFVQVGFVVEKGTVGRFCFRVPRFFHVSMIPPWLSILMNHLGMINRSVSGHSSETCSHRIHMNSNEVACFTYYIILGIPLLTVHGLRLPHRGCLNFRLCVYVSLSKSFYPGGNLDIIFRSQGTPA
jgi:hypothetical protein